MTQDRFHSPTRSAASISPLGDQMLDVTTRADDRWARLTLLLRSQREEDWRELVKSGKMVNTIEPSTCSHSTSARQKGANQYARWENCTKCRKDSRRRSAMLEGGEGSTRESFGEGGNGQKDGGTEEQSFPSGSETASTTNTSSHSRTDERSVEERKTEQNRVRTWTTITNSHSSSEQQYQRSPRGSAQRTGTASRVPATHVGAAITDAASSSTAGVCSDGSHSTARGNAASGNGVDIRGDAAKDLARIVRDGSIPEGQRLREQLWVCLHLQDEEAAEPVPKQLQSWLTGQRTQQRKEFKKNRPRHSSQMDLIEIFSPPRIIPQAARQGLRTTTRPI